MRRVYWVTRTSLDSILNIEPWVRVGKAKRVQVVGQIKDNTTHNVNLYPITLFPDQAARVQKYLNKGE